MARKVRNVHYFIQKLYVIGISYNGLLTVDWFHNPQYGYPVRGYYKCVSAMKSLLRELGQGRIRGHKDDIIQQQWCMFIRQIIKVLL